MVIDKDLMMEKPEIKIVLIDELILIEKKENEQRLQEMVKLELTPDKQTLNEFLVYELDLVLMQMELQSLNNLHPYVNPEWLIITYE